MTLLIDKPYEPSDAQAGQPDLTVEASNIWMVPQRALGGEAVELRALIRNIGGADATDVSAQFGDNADGAAQLPYTIGTDAVDVPAGGSAVAEVSWDTTAEYAENLITVTADLVNNVPEGDEDNNTATTEIFVSAPTGDVDCLNGVNITDALAILRWDAGLDFNARFPCPVIGE